MPANQVSLLHQSSNTLEDDTCRFSVYSAGNEALAIQAELETYWGMKQFKYSLTKTEFIWHSGYPPELKSVNDNDGEFLLIEAADNLPKWVILTGERSTKALQIDPNLTGLAVKAFCEKDVDSFKSCREMIKFRLRLPAHLNQDSINYKLALLFGSNDPATICGFIKQ
ncbi:hypothetical protein H4Q26_003408 [Puccinia striiformis f. sp. tritici PST-130]|nr:hypothetical protein H4Q26_003408 [Puccinia striiformis f. sp. tritici PST-130]